MGVLDAMPSSNLKPENEDAVSLSFSCPICHLLQLSHAWPCLPLDMKVRASIPLFLNCSGPCSFIVIYASYWGSFVERTSLLMFGYWYCRSWTRKRYIGQHICSVQQCHQQWSDWPGNIFAILSWWVHVIRTIEIMSALLIFVICRALNVHPSWLLMLYFSLWFSYC
jgi:hypothetical protein